MKTHVVLSARSGLIACLLLGACASGPFEPAAALEPTAMWPAGGASVRVAQAPSHKSKAQRKSNGNAKSVIMRVTAWHNDQLLDSWTGQTRWDGAMITYRALVQGGKLEWQGAKAIGIRVNTDASGAGGKSLAAWIPRGATEVIIRITADRAGKNLGGGTSAKQKRPAKPKKPGDVSNANSGGPDESASGMDGGRSSGKARQPVDSAGGDGTAGGDRATDRDGVGVYDWDADRAHDARGASTEPSEGGFNAGEGSRYGRVDGDSSGHEQGRSTELGGVADAYASRSTGELFGDKEGGKGGDGQPGDAGARGALAWWGGIINVPREWRTAVEVALIGADVLTPSVAFKAILKKGIRKLAIVQVRSEIRAQAAAFAKSEVKRLRKRFRSELGAMAAKDRDKLLRSTEELKQRQYFDKVEQGARNRRRHLERKLQSDVGNKQLRAEVRDARKIEDAAAVKPVEGRMPLNHEYAGTLYRVDNLDQVQQMEAIELIKGSRRAGVHFSRQGYPDFTPWMYKQGDMAADVRIAYTGSRRTDFQAARDAMRKRLNNPTWKKPEDYTWHHHEDVGRMILVPTPIHRAVPHTGGIPHYRMATCSYDTYPR